jgi:hypothetical protein
MKNYNIFKNYVTQTVFNRDSQEFEERRIEEENYDDSPLGIPEAPLALAFMVVGLQRPTKHKQRR